MATRIRCRSAAADRALLGLLTVWLAWAIACAGVSAATPVRGVTADRILIGLEADTASFSSDEENLGMRLVMAEVNARGGIEGRRLEARGYARQDGAAIDEQVANARHLVEEDGVFLLFNMGGPAAVRIAPYAMSRKVPYMFPHSALVTADADRYVFTSFPRYEGETTVMFKYLSATRGFARLGIVHDANEYGRYFRDRLAALAPELGYTMAGAEAVTERKPGDLIGLLRHLRQSRPEAVILALYPEQAQAVMKARAALGWDSVRMVATGPLTDEQYLEVQGASADGTIGFCLYPDPNTDDSPGVAAYRHLMAQHYPGRPLNRYSLYGYVFGRLVEEGLRRAGRDLTTEGFIAAMESIREWDSGGVIPPVSFSAANHHAQRAGFICELRAGHFEPATGWIAP
ncbi:MAG TPA: ABC transporter substrate-binding protein [Vicinamibacterales bacterium]|nr:ABC transporter substrate-binding protein [Vicinamibacterales bacterium]